MKYLNKYMFWLLCIILVLSTISCEKDEDNREYYKSSAPDIPMGASVEIITKNSTNLNEYLQIKIGFGQAGNGFTKAALIVKSPDFEIVDSHGNTYISEANITIDDFSADKYVYNRGEPLKSFENFQLKYIGTKTESTGAIVVLVQSLEYKHDENGHSASALLSVFYKISNGNIELSTTKFSTTN